jgi:cardiolipin synthase
VAAAAWLRYYSPPMAARVFTVPNQLTFLRLGFLPFFIILVHDGHYAWALAILALAAITDGMDGILARSLNQKSVLGAYLDPIADKLLLSSSFVVLALEGKMRWWVTILVLSRDALMLITAAVIMVAAGFREFTPSIYGKLTTMLQILLVFVVLAVAVFPSHGLNVVRQILIDFVAAFTVFSGFHYSIVVTRRLSQHSPA